MMQDTQRESIGFDVGSTGLIPFDVGSFDSKSCFPQADIKPTNSTSAPVTGQEPHTELRVTCSTGDRLDLEVESYSVQNVFMDGLWKVPYQEVSGNLDQQPWMVTEDSIDRRRKPTADLVFEEFALF